jgi:hypothetical protein
MCDGWPDSERREWLAFLRVIFGLRFPSSVSFYPLFSRRISLFGGGAPESALELWPSFRNLRRWTGPPKWISTLKGNRPTWGSSGIGPLAAQLRRVPITTT